MDEITKKQYVADGGIECPYCGSQEIVADQHSSEYNQIFQDVICQFCGKIWVEIFTLTDVEEKS